VGLVIRTVGNRDCRHWHHRNRTPEEIENWRRYCSRPREEWRDLKEEARMWAAYRKPAPARGDR
jgi:hypothetical protein